MARKCVVLDLDETLIHSVELKRQENIALSKKYKSFVNCDHYRSYIRPGSRSFLKFLFTEFNVGVWTAAGADYARSVVNNLILPEAQKVGERLKFVYSNHECSISKKRYQTPKDLRLVFSQIDGFSSDNTILIDDLEKIHRASPCNVYQIAPFKCEETSVKVLQDTVDYLYEWNDAGKTVCPMRW